MRHLLERLKISDRKKERRVNPRLIQVTAEFEPIRKLLLQICYLEVKTFVIGCNRKLACNQSCLEPHKSEIGKY